MSFANLQGTSVSKESTARFVFEDLPGEPWLQVRLGGQMNKPYFQAVLAAQSSKGRRKRKKTKAASLSVAELEKNRELDRELYPEHIDGGAWGGWLEDDPDRPGKYREVPYSPEAFGDLMAQLEDYLFDELRAFCNEPLNFSSEDEPDLDDIEATAGN